MVRVGRAKERGATLFGIEADEDIHALINVMSADAPYTVIERAAPVHPTVSELPPTLFSTLKPLD